MLSVRHERAKILHSNNELRLINITERMLIFVLLTIQLLFLMPYIMYYINMIDINIQGHNLDDFCPLFLL